MSDYYECLGLKKTATEDEIRARYRELAQKWHPDRNPGNPEAEKIFKDITHAYSVLSDSKERAQYDSLGNRLEGVSAAFPHSFDDVIGTLEQIFGEAKIRRSSGRPPESQKYACSFCHGKGKLNVTFFGMLTLSSVCTFCQGTGYWKAV